MHGTWSEPVAPFRIVGNIYYVGPRNIASYLITTSEGHILIDTGTRKMEPLIRDNIARLGFSLADGKILLCSHAHYDHVQGHAAVVRASGARVFVMREDAEAVRSGIDRSPLGDEGWEPVPVDRALATEMPPRSVTRRSMRSAHRGTRRGARYGPRPRANRIASTRSCSTGACVPMTA